MAQACNPSYLGGGDWKDCGSRPAQAKGSWDPTSTGKAGKGGTSPIITGATGNVRQELAVQAGLGKKQNSIQREKGCRCGSKKRRHLKIVLLFF
jgi:hypothetical protein